VIRIAKDARFAARIHPTLVSALEVCAQSNALQPAGKGVTL
jgi:hypothetical protein